MSAQVVLRPAGGGTVPGAEIRADHAKELEPDLEAARTCRSWFEQRGFEVSPLTGNSFSISGDAEVFARTLGGDLSARRLPAELRDSVEAITTSPGEPLG